MFLLLSGTLKEQSAERDTLQRHLNDAENKLTHLDKVCFCDVDFHKSGVRTGQEKLENVSINVSTMLHFESVYPSAVPGYAQQPVLTPTPVPG